jgi:hypothetical protein
VEQDGGNRVCAFRVTWKRVFCQRTTLKEFSIWISYSAFTLDSRAFGPNESREETRFDSELDFWSWIEK